MFRGLSSAAAAVALSTTGCGAPTATSEIGVDATAETRGSTTTSSSSETSTSGLSTSAPSTGDTSTDTTGAPLDCELEVGEPLLLSAEHYGRVSLLDLDGDGSDDLFGSRGRGLLGGFERPTTVTLIEDPPNSAGFGGHFVSPTTPGAVYIDGGGAMTVYASLDEAQPASAAISGSTAIEVTDLDGDGLDDVALLATSFDTVELWRSDGRGGFVQHASYETGGGLPALGVASATRTSSPLILVGGADVRGVGLDPRRGDDLSVRFVAELSYTYTLAGVETRADEQLAFLAATFFQQLTAQNRVGFSALRGTGWTGRAIDLDADEVMAQIPVATDLNADGVLDALIVVESQGTTRVIGACSAGDAMERCFDVPIDLRVDSLTVLPSPSPRPRWVLGSERDGLWGMEARGCQ